MEGDDMATQPEGTRILIVDDDPDMCSNLSDILTDLGYQVEIAHDGPAASPWRGSDITTWPCST
jgi:DNA-binding NtrC family response regulator